MNIKTFIQRVRHIKRTKVIYPFFTSLTMLFFAGVMFHALSFLTGNISKALDPVALEDAGLHIGDAKLVIVLKRLNVPQPGTTLSVATSTKPLTPISTPPTLSTTTESTNNILSSEVLTSTTTAETEIPEAATTTNDLIENTEEG